MIRTIKYTVSKDFKSITPSSKQWGGMQFEDNATVVNFAIPTTVGSDILWRIDFDSPSSGYDPSENLTVTNGEVSRPVPYKMTRYGGEVQVTLVGTTVNSNNKAERVIYSIPVTLYFTDVEQHEKYEGEAAENISAAEKSAIQAASLAETGAQNAKTSASEARAFANEANAAADKAVIASNEATKKVSLLASNGLTRKIVDRLPDVTNANEATLYMVKNNNNAEQNIYDEYMLIEGVLKNIGSTSVDLSDYATKAELVGAKTAEGGEVFNHYAKNIASNKYSHAEGNTTKATGIASHTEGEGTQATGNMSHSEGGYTEATAEGSHSEGRRTHATGYASHAEGLDTTAEGWAAHAEGGETSATGTNAHAEGKSTLAIGYASHAEGQSTEATGGYSHAEGKETTAESEHSHAEGYSTHAQNSAAHAEGYNTYATGENSHAEGNNTLAQGKNSHAEGSGTTAGGGKHTDVNEGVKDSTASHAEGIGTMAYGQGSHAEGRGTITGEFDEDGNYIVDSGAYCHAEGEVTQAIGRCSHAEGNNTKAIGSSSHAEGIACKAIGHNSHAEGDHTEAVGNYSHAEGRYTEARGFGSHAEGEFAVASGFASHAEGGKTVANGWGSHAEGYKTRIDTTYGHVQGCNNTDYTADEANDFLHVVGNGYVDEDGNTIKQDAHTLNKAGYGNFSGGVGGPLADYAEFFEWQDGNPEVEDRIGLIVTLDSDKIKLAKSGDEVLGIVSGTALVIGDDYETSWSKKFLTDDFGRIVYKEIEQFVEILKDDGTSEKKSIGFEKCPVVNPEYDPEQVYINRHDRQEWDVIGMLGKLYVRDDGTAQVNGYVTASTNGIATTTLTKTNMRVLSRVNDNVIRVLLK